jgi:hemerythrin superfamily protein
MPPLERHPLLRPVSREHHDGLLLCWKLRQGLAKGVGPKRMQEYCTRFYHDHLLPHFAVEEEAVFPILGMNNHLVRRAMKEHKELSEMFLAQEQDAFSLSNIEKLLMAHIRFEERVLFQAVQEVATEEQLAHVEKVHGGLKSENAAPVAEDAFWVT